MTSPISARARDYVRSRATAVMEYECQVERVDQESYSEDLVSQPATRTVLYTGPFRLWEITGSSTVSLGGEVDIEMSSVQASFPYDTMLFRRFDEIVITNTTEQDSALLGKRFRIKTKALAGELRPTRRYVVEAVN